MALISFNETDTSDTFDVGCSGEAAGASTAARQAADGGTLGSIEVSADPGNNVTRSCFAFVCGAPGASASWDAGTWVVRINHSSMDGGTQLVAVYVCDFLSGTGFTSIASNTSPGHTRGAAGVLTVNVSQGSPHTPQGAASQPFIVLVYNNNDQHGASGLGITPDQAIDTPIDDGAAAGIAPAVAMHHLRQMAAA